VKRQSHSPSAQGRRASSKPSCSSQTEPVNRISLSLGQAPRGRRSQPAARSKIETRLLKQLIYASESRHGKSRYKIKEGMEHASRIEALLPIENPMFLSVAYRRHAWSHIAPCTGVYIVQGLLLELLIYQSTTCCTHPLRCCILVP
jgi:hypothetical protein